MTAGGATTGFRIRQVIVAVAVLTAVVVVVPAARATRAEALHPTFAPGDVLVGVDPRYNSNDATVLNDDYLVGMQWRDQNGRPPVTGFTECSTLAVLSCLPGTTSTASAGFPGDTCCKLHKMLEDNTPEPAVHCDGGLETTGLAFDANDNLYVLESYCRGVNPEGWRAQVLKYDSSGGLLGRVATLPRYAFSLILDRDGNAYIGQAGTDTVFEDEVDIVKFDASWNPVEDIQLAGCTTTGYCLRSFDMAQDQCTIYYNNRGNTIMRHNLCTNTPLSDFSSGLEGGGYGGSQGTELRILPDGRVLATDLAHIHLLDTTGAVVKTYDQRADLAACAVVEPVSASSPCAQTLRTSVGDENEWYQVSLDPDGKSFWAATRHYLTYCITMEACERFIPSVYQFDIESGSVLNAFKTNRYNPTGSMAVFHEITVAGVPTVGVSNFTITEGDSGTRTASFAVTLNAPLPTAITVSYSTAPDVLSPNQAAAGLDYVPVASGTVTIPAGATEAAAPVEVVGDTLTEATETFLVNLAAATGGVRLNGPQGTGYIVDNDDAPPAITLPEINLPEITPPGVTPPDVTPPLVTPQAPAVPNVPIPNPALPNVAVPTVAVPNVPVPNLVVLNVPVPNLVVPNIPVPTPVGLNVPVPTPVVLNVPVPTPVAANVPVPSPVVANVPVPTPVVANVPVAPPVVPNVPVPTPVVANVPVPTPVAPNVPVPTVAGPSVPVVPNAPSVLAPNAPVAVNAPGVAGGPPVAAPNASVVANPPVVADGGVVPSVSGGSPVGSPTVGPAVQPVQVQPGLVAKRQQQQAEQVELAYAEVEDEPESLSASSRSPEVPVGVLPGVVGAGLLLFGFGLSGRRKQQRRPVQARETTTSSSGKVRDVDFERRHWR